MKLVHRIGLRLSQGQRQTLLELGVAPPPGTALPGGGDPLVAFDLDENNSNWPRLQELLKEWNASDFVRTEFSTAEVNGARWLEIGAWHHGYPQPEEGDFGYLRATYDLTDWCKRCGIGKRQRAPFQMNGEPKWGRNGIMQLIWVYDELFVRPEVWSQAFQPEGIACRPVLSVSGVELRTVLQLVIDAEVSIESEGLPREICTECKRSKLLPVTRGPFPPLTEQPSKTLARTREYFGSGGLASNGLVISQGLAQALSRLKLRGQTLRPVDSR